MSDKEMLEWIQSTITKFKSAIENGKIENLDKHNLELINDVMRHCRYRVLVATIAERLKSSQNLKIQIEAVLDDLYIEEKMLEQLLLVKKGELREKRTYDKSKKVYKAFNEEINKKDISEIESQIQVINEKIKRCKELIVNFGDPDKFIDSLVGEDVEKVKRSLVGICVKSIKENKVTAGFNLEDDSEIEELLNIALNPDLVDELTKFVKESKEIKNRNSAQEMQENIDESKAQYELFNKAQLMAGGYLENISKLMDCVYEIANIDGQEEDAENKPLIKRLSKKEREASLDREEKKEENLQLIGVYSGSFEQDERKIEVMDTLVEIWNRHISNNYVFSDDLSEEFDYIPEEQKEKLETVLKYLNAADDREIALKELVEVAIKELKQKATTEKTKLDKLKDDKKKMEKGTKQEYENLISSLSPEVQDIAKKGKASDIIALNRRFKGPRVKGDIVPPVALITLGKLAKEPIDYSMYAYDQEEEKELTEDIVREVNDLLNDFENDLIKIDKIGTQVEDEGNEVEM